MRRALYISALLIFSFSFYSSKSKEYNVDSLTNVVYSNVNDSIKVNALIDLAWAHYVKDIDTTQKLVDKAFNISQQNNNLRGLSKCYAWYGFIFEQKGNYDEALDYNFKSIKLYIQFNNKEGLASAFNNIGNILRIKGEIQNALNYYDSSLFLRKELKRYADIAQCYNNIGFIYMDQGFNEKALKEYYNAYHILDSIDHKFGAAYVINNIAYVYKELGENTQAIDNFKKGLSIREELGDKKGVLQSQNNIASIYEVQQKYDSAQILYESSLDIAKEIGDLSSIAYTYNSIGNLYFKKGIYGVAYENFQKAQNYFEQHNDKKGLSHIYSDLAKINMEKKQFSNSEKYALKSYRIASSLEYKSEISDAALLLSEIYEKLNNHKLSLKYYKVYKANQDSIFNEKSRKASLKTQIEFEFDKKALEMKKEHEKETIISDKKIAVEKEKQKRQFTILIVVIIASILVFILLIVIYKRLRLTKQQKLIIEEQKEEVEAQRDEIESQKNMVEDAHQEIKDSIIYAKRIQNAILPTDDLIKKSLPESFVLYLPKDVVAGDFYWLQQINDIVLFAAADCTGHGVPGAMVSVVCNNAINRAVREFNLTEPAKILDKTREIVLDELSKSNQHVKDGMDIALCSLNGNFMQFSGAYNPLWIIRNNQILETKADKQPIGKFERAKPFTNHNLELEKGDIIYIFSDGYVDQFGGEKDKKFGSKQFKEILISIHQKPMNEQKEILTSTLQSWIKQANSEPLDDVCIFAVRI